MDTCTHLPRKHSPPSAESTSTIFDPPCNHRSKRIGRYRFFYRRLAGLFASRPPIPLFSFFSSIKAENFRFRNTKTRLSTVSPGVRPGSALSYRPPTKPASTPWSPPCDPWHRPSLSPSALMAIQLGGMFGSPAPLLWSTFSLSSLGCWYVLMVLCAKATEEE